MECPTCRHPNPGGSNFCEQCGARLEVTLPPNAAPTISNEEILQKFESLTAEIRALWKVALVQDDRLRYFEKRWGVTRPAVQPAPPPTPPAASPVPAPVPLASATAAEYASPRRSACPQTSSHTERTTEDHELHTVLDGWTYPFACPGSLFPTRTTR